MSTITSQTDGHCHYTGSLSKQYLQNRINLLFPDQNLLVADFLPQFTSDWKTNFKNFFTSYQKIQNLTKSQVSGEQYNLYSSGAYDICRNYLLEGISSFDLRAGPKLNLQESISRINAMSEGFAKAEKELNSPETAKILLTLIHDQDGKYANVTPQSLTEILNYLGTNSQNTHRILGFDFSGPESNLDTDTFFSLLDILENSELGNRNIKRYLITVHAGEYSDIENVFDRYAYIDQLLDHRIDRISHGTILWLDPSLIDIHNQDKIVRWQEHLLQKIADKSILLEICPTANLLLSPLKSISDIPFSKFTQMGIKYSINTDNKTLINTTLSREISLSLPH
jgi:adenosine deaminase